MTRIWAATVMLALVLATMTGCGGGSQEEVKKIEPTKGRLPPAPKK